MEHKALIKKIGIGTVQFGLDYGINNPLGKVPFEEVQSILQYAQAQGIDTLDTARVYGDSEEVIGRILPNLNFQIVSKFSEAPRQAMETSLGLLNRTSIYAYLWHSFKSFKENIDWQKELLILKDQQKVQKVGFSLYYPSELEELLEQNVSFDIVQVPYNLFDRRFEKLFPILKKEGIEIHVRSIFLQGLFFIPPDNLKPHFQVIYDKQERLHQLAKQHQIPLAAILLNFVLLQPWLDKVVIGMDKKANLVDNVNNLSYYQQVRNLGADLSVFQEDKEEIILPFNWQ